ncbi:MAG TPA: CotH kinase family protein [Bacteroidia bacterium]|jgi:subtilisin-like proprotein convertase family protein|nr:CotH kinase family protein [Bacteroidia bacterium]
MKKLLLFILLLTSHVSLLTSQTYSGSTGAINDVATNDFTCNVSALNPAAIDTVVHGLETVQINLTHTYDSDLKIQLIAPDGTTTLLCNGVGGGGDDFTNTVFDINAATSIGAGSPPFTGSFTPQGMMGMVNNGQNGNGTWTLRVIDQAAQDFGTMLSWSLTFGNNPATYSVFSSSNMPIVIINTNNQTIVQTGKIMADMGIIYNGVGIRNHMTDPWNNYNGKIGIELRGNYSAGLPQVPYDFETRDINGNAIDASLLTMPSENDWCLIAMYNDKAFMRNALSYSMFEEMGHWGPRSKLCEVVLNGEYQGVYELTESIKRDVNRVDIAKLKQIDITYPEVTGGYILKTDYWDATNSWQLSYSPIDHPGFDIHMVYVYPDKNMIMPQQKTYIASFFDSLETALYGPNFTDPVNGYRKYMSTNSFIDFFIVEEMSRNTDGFKKSCYFYKEKDDATTGAIGKLKAGPVWDFDWAWKNIWDCSIFQATDGSGWSYHVNDCNPDVYGTGYYVRLLQDSTFANELHCRWEQLRATILDTTYLFHKMDSIAAYSSEAQARHYAYWGNMGIATGTPEVDAPRQSYQAEVDSLKSWIWKRIVWLDANMPGNSMNCNYVGIPSPQQNVAAVNVYPNPFSTQIDLSIYQEHPVEVKMELYNAMGQLVQPAQVQMHNGGNQDILFAPDATLPSGVYLLRITAGTMVWTRQLSKVE